jgi:hypothetical protein
MDVHFIAIEIGIERGACTLIESQGLPLIYSSPERHN